MNIICKIFGHKIDCIRCNVYEDQECVRTGCSHIVKGLKLPPMPKCKPPKQVKRPPNINSV